MPSKTNHTNSKKHGQIVKTAETLFTRHGIKRITVEEICQKAGVSKMTFYKYFSNKTDLVAHICNNWIEEGFEKLDEINALDIPFPEKIEMMFKWRTELVSKMSTEFIEEVLPIDLEYGRITERILEIRPEFIAAVIDKMHDLARNEKLMRIYPSYIEFNRELKDFFWFGLLPRPPHPKE
jgi:AcrR family transcriptional regulator